MSCLIDDIRAFISVNESASLVEFVENNLKSFEDHQFESVEELSKGLKELFEKVYLDLRPSTTKISLDIKAVLIKEAFLYNKITTEAARNALFQWFYLLCENHNVEEFMEKNADMINAVEKTKTSNPKALMDKMSVQLLKHYENLSPNEKNVLRLSLSYIVDMSKNNLAIYEKYISSNRFWHVVSSVKSDINSIEEEEKKNLETISKQIVEACKKGIDEGLEIILTQQLKLIKDRKRHSSEYQMVQSFSYLLHNFETWSKRKKESEAEKVARINELLTIVFNDSCLVTKTGETVGKSTHETYFLNEHNFSGGNSSNYNTSLVSAPSVSPSSPSFSSHIGRKIDLVVCNDQDAELAFCEFKSTNKKHLIQSQASKNLRLNQTIKINMWKMFVDEPIVFFNWEGRFGEFHSMQETSGIFVSQRKEAIVIPTSQKTLDDKFATTFIAFLKWKAHLLDVEQKIAKALISPDRREYEYPATCFTVVNNKKRKTSA